MACVRPSLQVIHCVCWVRGSSCILLLLNAAEAFIGIGFCLYHENNELAVLVYSERLRSCHTGDGPIIKSLQDVLLPFRGGEVLPMQFRSHARKILVGSYVAEASRKLLLERDGEGGPLVEMVISVYPLARASIDRALKMM